MTMASSGRRIISLLATLGVGVAGICPLGCAPNAQQQQLRQLTAQLESLQAQAVRRDQRVEDLTNRIYLLTDQVEHAAQQAEQQAEQQTTPALAVVQVEPDLSVADTLAMERVDLDPTEDLFPGEFDSEPPVEITLHGDQPPPLPVVEVPPVPTHAAGPANDSGAKQLFGQALDAYQAGNTWEAYRLFSDFAARHAHHRNTDNALFWMGVCRYELGEYQAAIRDWRELTKRFSRSSKAAEALFKTALALERLERPADAQRAFAKVARKFPNSAVAILARSRSAGGNSAAQGGQ